MQIRNSISFALLCIGALNITPADAASRVIVAATDTPSLLVKPHLGAEAMDVSGRSTSSDALTITLVSTIDRDVPDVVLSRTNLVTGPDGTYSAVISTAPASTRGSIITVYVSSAGRGPAVTARFLPDAPNRGVVIPYDDIPREDR
jgi:hypothetical protein